MKLKLLIKTLMRAEAAVAVVFITSIGVMTYSAAAGVKPDKMALPTYEDYAVPSIMRGPFINDFFNRHELSFRRGAAIHAAHGAAHDLVLLNGLTGNAGADQDFNDRFVKMTLDGPPKSEAKMVTFGPTTSQFAWDLYRVIDWTHVHHEMTYDILSAKDIPWEKKKAWTDKAVKHYLDKLDIAFSPAPLDYTMRRAGTIMKPYFTYFRNYYPKTNNYFYVAHWWHPVIYEAMMIGGNDDEQSSAVSATDELIYKVMQDRPQRMLLTREAMPRYARMSPESGNVFDNLHMLHGIAYDILTYPKWSWKEKEAELYRVINALKYHPGDELIARKFSEPHPSMDPRVYHSWMKSCEGAMNDIMLQMLDEMMPLMASDYAAKRPQAQAAAMKKLCPGDQEGEVAGALHDAMMAVFPNMKKMSEAQAAGTGSPLMMQAMLSGWLEKQGKAPEIPLIGMADEPSLARLATDLPEERLQAAGRAAPGQDPGREEPGSEAQSRVCGENAKTAKNQPLKEKKK
ncbi:MAG: hypothetical protein A2428_10180 [Bdellovibrionales bacterium RIFOXYC1_FULL_54_43]|nr:MAG: hypothetical protein A2428_10180 [Bdellovibrionales bacterium RIFOXYC1_FULL_54_43]OFZ80513.1 MAG: hypothetical protein A2603_13075 [Bdellovibrionales bacterium RIFOXYD1_FULL_55_31]